jgi:hypothetical protein
MTRLEFARLTLVLLFIVSFATLLSAQAGEVYVFGGGAWSGNKIFGADKLFPVPSALDNERFGGTKVPGAGTYGFKVGGFVDESFELDGNLSWYNHFLLKRPDTVFNVIVPTTILEEPKVRSLLWEFSGTYHFSEQTVGTRVAPYLTLGMGGMTARVKDGDSVFDDGDSVFVTGGGFIRNPFFDPNRNINQNNRQFIPNPARRIVMDNGDTFFTFSYGGGVKGMRVWGPMGFRLDFRGRTIPNYYSESITRPELTGGLIFNWGER